MTKSSNGSAGDGIEEDVGYRRPPVKHRFKKGQSGNPAGRKPKNPLTQARLSKRKMLSIIHEELTRLHPVNSGGKQTQMETFRIVVRNMLTMATKDGHLARHTVKLWTDVYLQQFTADLPDLEQMTDEDLAALEAIYTKYV